MEERHEGSNSVLNSEKASCGETCQRALSVSSLCQKGNCSWTWSVGTTPHLLFWPEQEMDANSIFFYFRVLSYGSLKASHKLGSLFLDSQPFVHPMRP